MAGGIFSGHLESPGTELVDKNGNHFKAFYGMSCLEANVKYTGSLKRYRTSEGKFIKVALKGNLYDTLLDINGGIRSACTYINANNIEEIYKNSEFIVI